MPGKPASSPAIHCNARPQRQLAARQAVMRLDAANGEAAAVKVEQQRQAARGF